MTMGELAKLFNGENKIGAKLTVVAMENWRRWDQQFWPAVYLVDRRGRVRFRWEGELGSSGEEEMAALIEKLGKE